MKFGKIFECSCVDGFTGDFCEYKTEQNTLLYLNGNNGFVFNGEGELIKGNLTFDANIGAVESCFTMLNGEAVIFGSSRENNSQQSVLTTLAPQVSN